jgi:hypothetical protein
MRTQKARTGPVRAAEGRMPAPSTAVSRISRGGGFDRVPQVVVDRAGLQVVLGHPERLLDLDSRWQAPMTNSAVTVESAVTPWRLVTHRLSDELHRGLAGDCLLDVGDLLVTATPG